MMRLLLTTFAFVILEMGMPHGASAAGFQANGESTRVMPRYEMLSSASPARAEAGAERSAHHTTTHFAPVARTWFPVADAQLERNARSVAGRGRGSLESRLPDARAPPA